jgi:hypothetical protein
MRRNLALDEVILLANRIISLSVELMHQDHTFAATQWSGAHSVRSEGLSKRDRK